MNVMEQGERYNGHENPAIRLLNQIADALPLRSIQRDILTAAILYLDGDLRPGGTVAHWWSGVDIQDFPTFPRGFTT